MYAKRYAKRITFLALSLIVLGSLTGCGINPTRPIPPQPRFEEVVEILSTLKSRPICIGSRTVYYDVSRAEEFAKTNPGVNFYFTKEFPTVLAHPPQEVVSTSETWALALAQELTGAGYPVASSCEEAVRVNLEFGQYMRQNRTLTILFGRLVLSWKGKRILLTRDDLFQLGRIDGRPRPLTLEEISITARGLARLNANDIEQVREMVLSRQKISGK